MKFYIEISTNAPKNRAEKAIQEQISEYHRALIPSEKVKSQLVKSLEKKLIEINKAHPRCGDVYFRIWDLSGMDYSISFGDNAQLTFKSVNKEIK